MSSSDGKIEYTNLGRAEIKRSGKKALLVAVCGREIWVPLSPMAANTAAEITSSGASDTFRVRSWFAQDRDLSGHRPPA